MKKVLLIALCAFSANGAFAQTSKINDVGTFNLRNTGAIMDKDKDVDGYYFYYVGDKLKKGDREFAIQIFDKNLTEVAKKTHIDDKNTFLMKSSFNNNSMMFALANFLDKKDEKGITLLTFDKQANKTATYDLPLSKNEIRNYEYLRASGDFNILFPVDNKGFIFNKLVDNKKIGYSLKYYPTDGGKPWEYNSPEDSKEFFTINPIEVNENIVVALESSRPGLLSKKITLKTKVLDVNTGKLLFEKTYSKDKQPRLITNAFLNSDNTVVFMGEYFKEGDDIMRDQSIGLFTEVLDFTGKTKSENLVSWAVDVAKLMKVKQNSNKTDKGYIYFHDVIKTGNNEYYAVGEYYRKVANAGGIAMAVLTQSASSNQMTQLSITDAVVFKFNSDFKLTAVQEFAKGKSRVPTISDYGSPQINAHAISGLGFFDYEYTQIDKKNDRFYSCFIDFERLKGEKNKSAFKTIIYDEGELTEDKIYLTQQGKDFRVMPAKIGNVLLVEYDKKAKEITMHLEKLNIK